MSRRAAVFLLLAAAVAAGAGDWRQDAALRDSLSEMGPLLGHRWLERQGLGDYLLRQSWVPESSGLRCVGRWSYGPSLKVSLRVTPDDTVICLTRGSGASLIRFRSQDSVTPDLLGDVNFAGIPRRAIVQDTLVVAGIHSGGTGLEVHGISNPASPNLLCRINLPVVNDIAVNDTLVYVACEDDSLRVFSIADPRNLRRLGACRDSCDLFMAQAGDYCYLVHVSGVNIVDVSNPASPHRAGQIGGGEPLAVYVRDTLAYVTIYQYGLRIYDVSDPTSPTQLGSLPGPDALDIGMAVTCDTVVYTPGFDVISVAQPASPRLLGQLSGLGGYGVGVVPALSYGLVARYAGGMVAVDIQDPAAPISDTTVFRAGSVVDIDVAGNVAFLASDHSGMATLDVSNPAWPRQLGLLALPRTTLSCKSVVADDSFAFVHWYQVPQFQSVDVSDPTRPTLAGGADVTNPPEDMVLRDTFIYVAEVSFFEVVNVARPRSPVLVGSCTPGDASDLCLVDTVAYASRRIVSVARPDNPVILGAIPGSPGGAIAVRDSYAFAPARYDSLVIVNVARPSSPLRVASLILSGGHIWNAGSVLVGDTMLYIGGDVMHAVNVTDACNPREVAVWRPPYDIRRVAFAGSHIYAACYEAGLCVLETAQLGIQDVSPRRQAGRPPARVVPNPARARAVVWTREIPREVVIRDVAGCTRRRYRPDRCPVVVDLTDLHPGLYFCELRGQDAQEVVKIARQ